MVFRKAVSKVRSKIGKSYEVKETPAAENKTEKTEVKETSLAKNASVPKKVLSKKKSTTQKSKTSKTGRKTTSSRRTLVDAAELNDLIAKQAYEFYLDRGSSHGDDQLDWYMAEAEVMKRVKLK